MLTVGAPAANREERMDDNNFQRIGSVSNAHVGRDFEAVALRYFRQQGSLLGE